MLFNGLPLLSLTGAPQALEEKKGKGKQKAIESPAAEEMELQIEDEEELAVLDDQPFMEDESAEELPSISHVNEDDVDLENDESNPDHTESIFDGA
jgi:hypothetical protein